MIVRYAYGVSNKAYQSPKGHNMSKYAKMDGLVEFVYDLREAGTPWDKDGGIVTQVKLRFPEYTTNSAIPLRNLYNAHKARVDSAHKMPATKRAVTKARDAGWGWAAIAGRAGISIKKAKSLYTGDHPEGRIYVDQDGKISTVKTDFTRPELEDDGEEEGSSTAGDSDTLETNTEGATEGDTEATSPVEEGAAA